MVKKNRLTSIITKKPYKYLILAVFSMLFAGALYQLIESNALSNKTASIGLNVEVYKSFQKQMRSLWLYGSSKKRLNEVGLGCVEYFQAMETMTLEDLKCNPDFIECVMQGKVKEFKDVFTVFYQKKKYEFKPFKNSDRFIEMKSLSEYMVRFQTPSDDFIQIKLKKNCFETRLDQAIYKNTKDFTWDNFGRQIYIDKYYVNNQDVMYWEKFKQIKKRRDVMTYYLPNTDLSLEEKKQFCRDHGKKLLTPLLFEASSLYYIRNDELVEYFTRPWSKRTITFLEKKELNEKNCYKAYIKGCEKFFRFKNKLSLGMSQQGIAHTLGSYLEELSNDHEVKNLKLSSLFYDLESSFHHIGEYGTREDLEKEGKGFKIAFRCFRESL
jgi:hypothetical protein